MSDLNLIEKYKNDDCLQYAFNEFKIVGWINEEGVAKDCYIYTICSDVCDLLMLIHKQKHLNTTYKQVISLVTRLAEYMPITELKGTDDEWEDTPYAIGGKKQNKRYAHIFKDSNGFIYNSNGRIFHEKNKPYCFSSICSDIFVEFPYYPPNTPERYELDENGLTDKLKDKLIKEEYQKWINSGKN